jgi:hypothetical protein
MAPKPQSSLGPTGIPPSGNGKYIAIALLLLGLIGAAIVWKLTQKPPPPITVVDAGEPDAKPTITVRDDDIPLPPEVPDAGPDGGKKVATGNWSPTMCDAKACTGARTGELETALSFRARQAHRCYDNALATDPTLRGKVAIAVRIGANGTVCSAGVASNEISNPMVANCVANQFRMGAFPSPKGGCLDVNVPINFVPRQ